jgi:hypothetical protein
MFLLAGNLPCLITDSCATFTGYNAALPQISFTEARSMYRSSRAPAVPVLTDARVVESSGEHEAYTTRGASFLVAFH